jgi:predicted CoA-binding protein
MIDQKPDLLKKFLDQGEPIALVYASNEQNSEEFQIISLLLRRGVDVKPVKKPGFFDNNILKIPCYPKLATIKPLPKKAIFTVNSVSRLLELIKEANNLAFNTILFHQDLLTKPVRQYLDQLKLDYQTIEDWTHLA